MKKRQVRWWIVRQPEVAYFKCDSGPVMAQWFPPAYGFFRAGNDEVEEDVTPLDVHALLNPQIIWTGEL